MNCILEELQFIWNYDSPGDSLYSAATGFRIRSEFMLTKVQMNIWRLFTHRSAQRDYHNTLTTP